MTSAEKWFLHIAIALTTISGVVFAFMKYFMTSDDPFAVANHPAQPFFLDAHVLAAPVALFGFGLIYRSHIWRKYTQKNGGRRKSGLSSMVLIVPMAFSGYLLQVSADETMREVMAVTHWITSGVFVVAYLAHQLVRRRARPEDEEMEVNPT